MAGYNNFDPSALIEGAALGATQGLRPEAGAMTEQDIQFGPPAAPPPEPMGPPMPPPEPMGPPSSLMMRGGASPENPGIPAPKAEEIFSVEHDLPREVTPEVNRMIMESFANLGPKARLAPSHVFQRYRNTILNGGSVEDAAAGAREGYRQHLFRVADKRRAAEAAAEEEIVAAEKRQQDKQDILDLRQEVGLFDE